MTMTTREQKLVKMVQEAMGTFTDLSQDQFGLEDKMEPIVTPQDIEEGEDIVQEKPMPKYESIEKLMQEIEEGTNKAMYEYKMNRMKELAEMIEAKVGSLEEGDHKDYINKKDIDQMRKDIKKLRDGEAKLRKEFDRKFNKKTKTSEPREEVEKEPVALAEGFDLKKFLVENKLTKASQEVKEVSN